MIEFGVQVDLSGSGSVPDVNLVKIINRTVVGLVRLLLGGYGG